MRSLLPLAMLAACAPSPEGLRATPPGTGPEVMVDWDAEPLPEIPFPNDLATTPDPTSPTGLRLNLPTVADTIFESEARQKLNELVGFGIYAPIQVRFTAPLDIQAILDRHPNDLHLPTTFDDDAFLVIDVDPDSPEFGKAVYLDVGHGRFPVDVIDPNRYFPNDTRAGTPSLLFDTIDEDDPANGGNGNGILDPGEDSDGDGYLDVANVWPDGGDPFEDLLTFYDRTTHTLLFRPVLPLREGTTYAVVLTNRLVGEDGQPVRSPWPWVNHTRQTAVLAPLHDVLGDYGLSVDDVAFAWTFTTGTPTRDLRDLRAGLFDGTGPWASLQDVYPAGFTEALPGRDPGVAEDRYGVEMARVVGLFGQLGLIGAGPGVDVLIDAFDAFSDRLVGAAFTVPYLLADRDDGGTWDADEWWKLDPYTRTIHHEPRRVTMLCVLPKPRPGRTAPFDVAIYGHGYGSTRLEGLLFGAVMNRFGFAVCSIDAPGHGPDAKPEEIETARTLLSLQGLGRLVDQIFDARDRDLDNDGRKDSGGDQWTADPFHTRDMDRQAVLEWMQLVRALRACGSGTFALADYVDGQPVVTRDERVSCDWDDDGEPDIGGPDARIFLMGGSLGGITTGIAAGILPEVERFVPVVPGGGIVDVGTRTAIRGAVEAFVGRFVSPLFLGFPNGDGSVRVEQWVNSVMSMRALPVGTLPSVPAGGTVRLTNLTNGLVAQVPLRPDGSFRVGVGADGLDPGEKRLLVGMPPEGPEPGVVYEADEPELLGDLLLLEVLDADGRVVATLDSWAEDVVHEGVTMRAGTPLIAGSYGNGKIRGAADARRLAYVTAMALEPGDPIAYAPHYFRDPFPEIGPRQVLVVPTPGDELVPVNAGIALARAAGVYDWNTVDDRYGTTVDQWLIDNGVIQGVEERGPFRDANGQPILFDVDDLDDGTDDYGAPSDVPLRAVVQTPVGPSGLRLPYVNPRGSHGFNIPDPTLAFDIHTYANHQIAWFLETGRIEDRPCFATADCPDFPPFPGEGGDE